MRARRAAAARPTARAGSGGAARRAARPASKSSDDAAVERPPAGETLDRKRLADDVAARQPRVERRVRVLEDDVHLAAERPQLAPRQVRDVATLQPDGAGGRLEQPDDAVADGRLAAPGLPDEPEHLARRDREADAVDGVHRAAAAEEVRPAVKCLTRSTTSSVGGPPRCRGWGHAPSIRSRDGSTRRGAARRPRAGAAPPSASGRRRAGSGRRTRRPSTARRGTGRGRGSRAAAACRSAPPGRGIAPISPIVYGCCGRANSSSTGASSTFRPAYITSTSSAMSATTPRLCVMRTIAVPSRVADVAHQVEDPGLDRDVERRRRLVGDEHLRIARERHRDHHALPHPARELVRVLARAPLRRRDPHEVEQLDGARVAQRRATGRGGAAGPRRSASRRGTPG